MFASRLIYIHIVIFNLMTSLMDRWEEGIAQEGAPLGRIDPRAIPVWRINGLLNSLFLILLALGVGFMVPADDVVLAVLRWLPLVGSIVWLFLSVIIFPPLRMRLWRYEIREDEVDVQRGIIVIRRTLVPMVRIQHVDTEHGPVLRRYGLATLKISTAASDVRIPALAREEADRLRAEISALARISGEDV